MNHQMRGTLSPCVCFGTRRTNGKGNGDEVHCGRVEEGGSAFPEVGALVAFTMTESNKSNRERT